VADPIEQLILQDHDNKMLERSVRESRVVRRGVQGRAVVNTGGRAAGAGAAAFQQQWHLKRLAADSRPSVFRRAAFPR
jgi:nitrogenase subunit NifH